jgi:hypothetical protein
MTRRCTTPTSTAPDVLTVVEAARIVRIGRTAAYDRANEYLDTDGASGLPVKRIGKQLRVPRHMLEEYLGGPITWPIAEAPVYDTPADDEPTKAVTPLALVESIPTARRRPARGDGSQLALGLDG